MLVRAFPLAIRRLIIRCIYPGPPALVEAEPATVAGQARTWQLISEKTGPIQSAGRVVGVGSVLKGVTWAVYRSGV